MKMTLLNSWSLNDVESYLQAKGLIPPSEEISSFSSAGEGNMNYTYRASMSSGKSLILKQAPPFCAKFPQIEAPIDRIFQENLYYNLSSKNSQLSNMSPEVYFFDEEKSLIVMKDLGNALDYGDLYFDQKLNQSDFNILVHYLSQLHKIPMKGISMPNLSMRTLNHAYIFDLPFNTKDAINLNEVTPGLNELAVTIHSDLIIKKAAQESGKIYLHDGNCLVHGDFYPRSWLKTSSGPMVIDPEFAHLGSREFDLAVFLAHMTMTEQDFSLVESIKLNYGNWDQCDHRLMATFYGVEIIRRVLHVAQLPLKNDLSFKKRLIDKARTSIIEEKI